MAGFVQKVDAAKQLVAAAVKTHSKICVGCSFGKDSMVTLHIVRTVRPDLPVVCVMANTEFEETYAFAKQVERDWELSLHTFTFEQVAGEICCGGPKVEMTKQALKPYDAWISGVRKTEGITRSHFEPVEVLAGLTKVNPILDFTELDIWRYLALYQIPVNPKYLEGYRSLGCALCSFPEEDEQESERAGRWRGTENAKGECGIHTQPLR